MSKLKVTTISDPDNDNTAITVDTSGNVTFAQNATFSGTVSGIDSGAKTISDDDTATYSDGDYFLSPSGIAYRKLNDGTSSAWYSLADGTLQTNATVYAAYSIAGDNNSSFYIDNQGTVYGIGLNSAGQLGVGDTTDRTEWTATNMTSGAKKLICKGGTTMVLKTDGSLWATGNNGGKYGDGTTTDSNVFIEILSSGVSDFSIGAGGVTAIIKTDGSLWTTGTNWHGALGDGTTTDRSSFGQRVSSGVTAVCCGYYETFYLNSSGAMYGCGYNASGALNQGNTSQYNSFTQCVSSGVSKLPIDSPYLCMFYINSSGALYAVGHNYYGQLGLGDTTNRTSYVQAVSSGVEEVFGGFHTFIIKTDGSLWNTGDNQYGQLGNGNTTNQSSFGQRISSGVVFCSLGQYSSLVLKDDNTIVSAGRNNTYQLGDETNTDRSTFGSTTATNVVGQDLTEGNKTVDQLT